MPAVRDSSGRPISIQLDTRALNAFRKRVERYQGIPLTQRMQKGTLEAARLLVPSVRAAAPKGPTGNLKRRVSARQMRSLGAKVSGFDVFAFGQKGKTLSAVVGSTAPHRHLVIRGHRIVTPGKRDTGRRTTGNPFVDSAAQPRAAEAIRVVSRAIFGEG